MKDALLAGNTKCEAYHIEYKDIKVGTKKEKHDSVYKKKLVVDKKAWTETVVVGHKCSGCGQTKYYYLINKGVSLEVLLFL